MFVNPELMPACARMSLFNVHVVTCSVFMARCGTGAAVARADHFSKLFQVAM